MNAYIELQNVSKVIKNKVLLDSINMSVNKGQAVGLVGRNGSGKTVLLKVICGIYSASEGIVKVDGKQLGKDISFPNDMGIIIEAPGFITSRSGYENLRLIADIRKKISHDEIRKCMRSFGLDPANRKKVGAYSLGMKQRLGLVQAVMEQPQLLILDEPFNGLDRTGIEEIRIYLQRLKDQGVTMVIATHSQEDIEALCDEVYKMELGMLNLRTNTKRRDEY